MAPNPALAATMARAEAAMSAAGARFHAETERRRRIWRDRHAAETFAQVDRRACQDVVLTSSGYLDALKALGIDLMDPATPDRDRLAQAAIHHFVSGWLPQRSAAVLRGEIERVAEAAE